jgi:hypothetical protein
MLPHHQLRQLQPSHGPNAAVLKLEQIEKSLAPAELETAEAWLKSLSPTEAQAILVGLGGRNGSAHMSFDITAQDFVAGMSVTLAQLSSDCCLQSERSCQRSLWRASIWVWLERGGFS